MVFNPDIHQRQSIRLKSYDYSKAGAYFVTICVREKECLLGDVVGGVMRLSEMGEIVREEWLKSSIIRGEIKLDEFVIMPNHMHGIIWICNNGRGDRPVAPTEDDFIQSGPSSKSLGSLMAGFKSAVTKRINIYRNTPGLPFWQRNYYEHVIRNENDLHAIREYIQNNPLKWELDPENPYK